MNKKPTIRQQISQLKKQKAAFDVDIAEMGKGPLAQVKKQRADFEAHLKQMKTQAAAPAMEAEKRRIEERKRLAKADRAARALIERPIKEHQARIAEAKKLLEAGKVQTIRLQQQEMAARSRLRGKL
jgi:hypothetical protein